MAKSRLKDALRSASDECLSKRYAGEMYLLNDTQLQEVAQKLHIAGASFLATVNAETATSKPDISPWAKGGAWEQGPTETTSETPDESTNQEPFWGAVSGGFGLTDALRAARVAELTMDRLRKRTKGLAEEMKRAAEKLQDAERRLQESHKKVTQSTVIYLHTDFDREIEEARQSMRKHANTLTMTTETANYMHLQLQEEKEENQ